MAVRRLSLSLFSGSCFAYAVSGSIEDSFISLISGFLETAKREESVGEKSLFWISANFFAVFLDFS